MKTIKSWFGRISTTSRHNTTKPHVLIKIPSVKQVETEEKTETPRKKKKHRSSKKDEGSKKEYDDEKGEQSQINSKESRTKSKMEEGKQQSRGKADSKLKKKNKKARDENDQNQTQEFYFQKKQQLQFTVQVQYRQQSWTLYRSFNEFVELWDQLNSKYGISIESTKLKILPLFQHPPIQTTNKNVHQRSQKSLTTPTYIVHLFFFLFIQIGVYCMCTLITQQKKKKGGANRKNNYKKKRIKKIRLRKSAPDKGILTVDLAHGQHGISVRFYVRFARTNPDESPFVKILRKSLEEWLQKVIQDEVYIRNDEVCNFIQFYLVVTESSKKQKKVEKWMHIADHAHMHSGDANGMDRSTKSTKSKEGVGMSDQQQLSEQGKKTKSVGLHDFTLLKVIGKGAFGKVLQVRKKDTNKMYAMKILKKENVMKREQIEHTKTERRVLGYIQHPFIVALDYAFQSETKLYLVLDYCPGGELFFHLGKVKRFKEDRARYYAAEITLALEYLHSKDIVYRFCKIFFKKNVVQYIFL
ncbi:hypothetical protein RFI_28606 [Reticulomyxa filosa]|uniref:non-specific serine/threonine protein kinase n=1 Tax=Reticulomyxa filosa TaxID=46433 RepID=X6M4B8_RETFI|nr:hypothetical protein RFI_28606 [Reticulomyxa filosa]|eukprot:ETO08774.1 hypothetical protein RFI_28606 [Reticulomyxa filosa]